jgi:biopolymer transport protein ExbB
MRSRMTWVMAAVAVALVLAAGTDLFAADGSGYVKAPRSVFNMFWVSTFTNVFGFLDHVIIWTCSIFSIALIVQYSLRIRKTILVPDVSVAQISSMFEERRFREALEFCQNDPSFVSSIVHAGLIEAANGYTAMENAMQDATSERAARLYRKIEWLNLLGNVAPMFGLWGTIWGMMVAFGEIAGKGGKADPADLAGGIMIALVSTFTGLFVAIPALSAYGIFKSRIEQMAMEAAMVAEELLANFKPTAAGASA